MSKKKNQRGGAENVQTQSVRGEQTIGIHTPENNGILTKLANTTNNPSIHVNEVNTLTEEPAELVKNAPVTGTSVTGAPGAVDTKVAAAPAPAVDTAPTGRLETFVEKQIPEYRKAQPKAQEETQSDDVKDFKAQQEKIKKEIDDKIKKIIEDADVKYKALSEKYKDAESNYNHDPTEENYKKLNEISVSINAVYDEKSKALDEIQKELDGDTTPTLIRWGKDLASYWINNIEAKFKLSI